MSEFLISRPLVFFYGCALGFVAGVLVGMVVAAVYPRI